MLRLVWSVLKHWQCSVVKEFSIVTRPRQWLSVRHKLPHPLVLSKICCLGWSCVKIFRGRFVPNDRLLPLQVPHFNHGAVVFEHFFLFWKLLDDIFLCSEVRAFLGFFCEVIFSEDLRLMIELPLLQCSWKLWFFPKDQSFYQVQLCSPQAEINSNFRLGLFAWEQ